MSIENVTMAQHDMKYNQFFDAIVFQCGDYIGHAHHHMKKSTDQMGSMYCWEYTNPRDHQFYFWFEPTYSYISHNSNSRARY